MFHALMCILVNNIVSNSSSCVLCKSQTAHKEKPLINKQKIKGYDIFHCGKPSNYERTKEEGKIYLTTRKQLKCH